MIEKNLLTKNVVPKVIERILSSQLVSKTNEMIKTKEMLMLDQNLPRNLLYNTFILSQTTEQNDMIDNIEVEVHQKKNYYTKKTDSQTDIALHLEIDLVMTRILLLHITHNHDMTNISETRDLITLLTGILQITL